MRGKILVVALALLAALGSLALVAGCGKKAGSAGQGGGAGQGSTPATRYGGASGGGPSGGSAGNIDLQGAGATFPYPLYSKWVSEYQKVNPQVRINYQSIGSGGGIRQITEKTVDFGASDVPMTDPELAKLQGTILHVPMTLGAAVVAYNLSGAAGIKLTPEVVAAIFLGEIKNWNDPKIAQANPGLSLPNQAITVAHRTDGSGTTGVFTGFLSAVSPEWKQKVGAGKSVDFPVGLGAKGNEGVAGLIKTTPGAVGYVELAYAKQTGLPYAFVGNQTGRFIEPTLESITAAAAGIAQSMPPDFRVSIVNAPGENAYPIASFTYILVRQDQSDAVKGKALAQFLWWAIHDGQRYGPPLDYAPLPPAVVAKEEAELRTMRANGQPLLTGDAYAAAGQHRP